MAGRSGSAMVKAALFGSTILASASLTTLAFAQSTTTETVSSQAAQSADTANTQLPAVTVQGKHEASNQPPKGYVARTSSTATKTNTPLGVTPQTISVVTQKQIEDYGAQTLAQALNYTAGVQNQPYGFDSRYDQLIIRGFSETQYGNYLNGLREGNGSFAYFRNDPYEMQEVDVLQGPASVLYGSNNPGGLINSISKQPTADPIHEMEMTFGNYANFQGQFDMGGSLTSNDSVLYRVVGLARDSNTQVPDTKNNRILLAPSVTVRLDDATSLTLMAEWQKNQQSMWPYYLYVPGKGLTHIRLGDPEYDAQKQEQWMIGYKLEHRLNDFVTLRQNFRFGRVDFYGPFVDENDLQGTTLDRYSGLWNERLTNTDVDNQAEFHFHTASVHHQLLAGVDYFHQAFNSSMGYGTAPSLDIDNPVYSAGPVSILGTGYSVYQVLNQVGFYAQDLATWGHWHFTFGAREDLVHTSSENLISGTTTTSDPSHFSWRTGLLYAFDNGIAPYFSYSTSFLPTSGTTSPARGSTAFVPTTGQQYEAGVKYQPRGWTSYVTADVYNLKQQNVLTVDPDNANYNVQTGEVRSRGFQIQGVADLGHGFRAVLDYAFTKAINTQSNTYQDKVPVGVPANQAGAFLAYSTPDTIQNGWGLGGGVRYLGSTWADAANTQTNDHILAVDMVAHKDFGKFRFQFNMENMFNNQVAVCNSGSCAWSLGRVVLGSVKVRW
jgi:iron complex outermembrane recepter protein